MSARTCSGSTSNVRADVIRQFHERGDDGMVDALVLRASQFVFRIAKLTSTDSCMKAFCQTGMTAKLHAGRHSMIDVYAFDIADWSIWSYRTSIPRVVGRSRGSMRP